MLPEAEPIVELEGITPDTLPDEVLRSTQPLVLRGLVAQWPLVQAGLKSAQDAIAYLRQFSRDATVVAMVGAHQHGGRLFYNEDMSGFNFHREEPKLAAMLDAMLRHLHDPKPPTLYMGSTTVDTFLPGLRGENDLDLGTRQPLYSIWVGNRSRIAAHHDVPDNLACVAAGRRRFTLFPPEQVANLYVGPLDLTPAGQAISLVDFHEPDLERFPKFADAMAHAQVAELGPGDALFIPSMWWHHVEALNAFNVLLNYWWRQSPACMDTPMNALMLAIMCVRDLPEAQLSAWREMFRHYVFEADETTTAHIPQSARGMLSPMTAEATRLLRAQLLKRLNR
jgi:Cupin-like domain